MVAVTLMITDGARYGAVGAECVLSALRNTRFGVHVSATEDVIPYLPRSRRLHLYPLSPLPDAGRAERCFRKMGALREMLPTLRASHVIQLDADAIFTRTVTAGDVVEALAGKKIGMAEQRAMTGSTMTRADYFEHYERVSVPVIKDGEKAVSLEAFHYFNSGVVLARTGVLLELVSWALERKARLGREHELGEDIVADQDYFQYWANAVRPGSCAVLDWTWNHCEHWDHPFPRKEARMLHFSNFALGPAGSTLERMRSAQGPVGPATRFKMAARTAAYLLGRQRA